MLGCAIDNPDILHVIMLYAILFEHCYHKGVKLMPTNHHLTKGKLCEVFEKRSLLKSSPLTAYAANSLNDCRHSAEMNVQQHITDKDEVETLNHECVLDQVVGVSLLQHAEIKLRCHATSAV